MLAYGKDQELLEVGQTNTTRFLEALLVRKRTAGQHTYGCILLLQSGHGCRTDQTGAACHQYVHSLPSPMDLKIRAPEQTYTLHVRNG